MRVSSPSRNVGHRHSNFSRAPVVTIYQVTRLQICSFTMKNRKKIFEANSSKLTVVKQTLVKVRGLIVKKITMETLVYKAAKNFLITEHLQFDAYLRKIYWVRSKR